MDDTTQTLAERHSRGGRLSSELRRREGLSRVISAYNTVVEEGRVPTQAAVLAEFGPDGGMSLRTIKRHWHRIPAVAARSSHSTAPVGTPSLTALVTMPEPAADDPELTIPDDGERGPRVVLRVTVEELDALAAAMEAAITGPEAEWDAACAAFEATAAR